jgi:hypothetical protein
LASPSIEGPKPVLRDKIKRPPWAVASRRALQ